MDEHTYGIVLGRVTPDNTGDGNDTSSMSRMRVDFVRKRVSPPKTVGDWLAHEREKKSRNIWLQHRLPHD